MDILFAGQLPGSDLVSTYTEIRSGSGMSI
jgi:hypothetical protein